MWTIGKGDLWRGFGGEAASERRSLRRRLRKTMEDVGKVGSLPWLVERFDRETLLMGTVRKGDVFVEWVEKGDIDYE